MTVRGRHAHKAGLQLLESGNQFDAVMCANDEVASGGYRAADAYRVRVSADVAVNGFDDAEWPRGPIRESWGCRSVSGRNE
jgi:DNA-binding LacI/PurR family transcriptional regulator